MSVGFALVTGEAGFIGSHLVDRLVSDGWRVECYIVSAAKSGEY